MRLFGLIGYPLSHSFSEKYFSEKFSSEGITDAAYRLFPLQSLDEFPKLLKAHPELCGLNVTIPYKEKIIPFLDELDPEAREIGAVNTIVIRNGKLKGYNTDAFGFRQSIKPFLTSHHERALILGTGGASKAIEYVLRSIGIDCWFVSREKKNASDRMTLQYSDLNPHVLSACKLIVNCTPLGTWPDIDQAPELPYENLTPQHLLYDLVYNPLVTRFMQEGRSKGAEAMNGYDMLKLQAERSWEIWNK